jgi:hypothetical protein
MMRVSCTPLEIVPTHSVIAFQVTYDASIAERRLYKVWCLRSASALGWPFLPGIITAAPPTEP